jgi:hypothetical protein
MDDNVMTQPLFCSLEAGDKMDDNVMRQTLFTSCRFLPSNSSKWRLIKQNICCHVIKQHVLKTRTGESRMDTMEWTITTVVQEFHPIVMISGFKFVSIHFLLRKNNILLHFPLCQHIANMLTITPDKVG